MSPLTRTIQIVATTAVATGALSTLSGCLREKRFLPESNWYLGSRDIATYASTSWLPQTVNVIDTRTGETIWSIDVPVGQQVVVDFNAGGGDNEYYPDTMRWALFEAGTGNGRLRNSIAVPPVDARLIEPTLRPAPEWPGSVITSSDIPEPIELPAIQADDTNN